MILAGIDEAGYGPVLGPLVVGACAFEVQADPQAELPCLWKSLRKVVSQTRSRDGKKLHINDSKLVYSTSTGLKELERAVLAVLGAIGEVPDDLNALLVRVAADVTPHMLRYPWYQLRPPEKFPLEQDALGVRLFANALRAEMQRAKTHCVHLAANVLCEGEFNRMCNATRNKSSVLFTLAAGHLETLLRDYGHRDLVIICDRQGGRGHYGSLLRLMFEEWALEITSEVESRSEYRLTRNGHGVRIVFVEKAEAQCLPVALASMLSKYLREAMMTRFNAWWHDQQPGLIPTAGYYTDGHRFLIDVADKRRELGIKDAQLIRSR